MKALKNSDGKRTRSNRSFDIVSIVTGCIVCIFHILGVSIPGWWVLEEVDPPGSTVKYYFGVWSTRTCGDGMCITETAKMSEERGIKHCKLGSFHAFLSSADFFSKINFLRKKIFQEYHQNVKQFRSRSGPKSSVQTVCQGYQQTTLVNRELKHKKMIVLSIL